MNNNPISFLLKLIGIVHLPGLLIVYLALPNQYLKEFILLNPYAHAHEWYPAICCSERDCMPINPADLVATPDGWKVMTNGEIIPYDSNKIKRRPLNAPPEAYTSPHVCFKNGDIKAEVICVYPMEQGS